MAIAITLRMFRLCPFHEKPGGCFPHLASHDIDKSDEPPERCSFGADPGGLCERTTRHEVNMV
jgi:hypothetical protein